MNKYNLTECKQKFSSEFSKNAEIERRRKLRLQEVRQRSNDFAADIRKKVVEEKNRQLQQYNTIKLNELNKWKQNEMKFTNNLYEQNLAKIGEAHLAAEQENIVSAEIREKNRQNQMNSKQRGVAAMQKNLKKNADAAEIKEKQNRKRINAKRCNIFVNTCAETTGSGRRQLAAASKEKQPIKINENLNKLSESVVEIVDISTDTNDDSSLSSSLEIQSIADKLSKTLPLVYTNDSTNYKLVADDVNLPKRSEYNPQEFVAVNDSTTIPPNNSNNDEELPFTQISQFLSNRRKLSTIDSMTLIPPVSTDQQHTTVNKPQQKFVHILPKKKLSPPKCQTIKSREYIPKFSKRSSIFKPTTVVSSSEPTISSSMPKVKFYDHPNRFTKEYHPTPNIVQRIEGNNAYEETAIDAATNETKFDDLKLEYLNELKKKAEIRSKECMEKEKIRKDYEKMLAQLEEISKKENYEQMFTNPHLTYDTQSKRNMELQEQLNQRIEQEFAYHPITCSRIIPDDATSTNMANIDNGALIIGAPLNSSDSANSILLNRLLSDVEIQQLLSKVKQEKLQLQNNEAILKSVENIATKSSSESNNNRVLQQNDNNKENNQQKIVELTKEKEELKEFAERMKAKEKSLERKAKKLFLAEMARKKRIDKGNQTKKISIQNVEIQTDDKHSNGCIPIEQKCSSGNNVTTTSSTINDDTTTTTTMESTMSSDSPTLIKSPPVKIVIKVNNDYHRSKKKYRKSSMKSPKKRQINGNQKSDKDFTGIDSKPYPKTPMKQRKCVDKQIEQQKCDAYENGSSTSTVYRTLPKTIDTELNKFTNPKQFLVEAQQNIKSNDGKQLNVPSPPMLRHYITRLLGMSRKSIEQLAITDGRISTSSTSIETPNDSIINITSNQSATLQQSQTIDQQHVEHYNRKLQKFIDDNHQFLNDMEESLHRVEKTTKKQAHSHDIGKIWLETLKQNSNRSKSVKENVIPSKSIIKNVEKSQPVQLQQQQKDDDEEKLKNLYAQLTKNCNQRFAELNDKINKVRQEKQKLLEEALPPPSPTPPPNQSSNQQQRSSSSSSSDCDMPSSEYCSFKLKQLLTENYDSSSQSVAPKNDQRQQQQHQDDDGSKNLHLNSSKKFLGLSRDSGICTSRPVTSSDIRDSPDIRTIKFDQRQITVESVKQHIETKNKQQQQQLETIDGSAKKDFEPLLKDIPKYFIEDMVAENNGENKIITTGGGVAKKSAKPPISLKRYSPHLEELPHELSTIIEIDTTTPATSQLNTSHHNNDNGKYSALANIILKKFTTFQEYAREHGLDLSKFDNESNLHLTGVFDDIDLKKILDWTTINPELMHQLFLLPLPIQSFNDDDGGIIDRQQQQQQQQEQQEIAMKRISDDDDDALKFRQFPKHHEYTQGVSELCDSGSIEKVTGTAVTESIKSNSGSIESLPDMALEAKKRNLIIGNINDNSKANWTELLQPTLSSPKSEENKKQKTAAAAASSSLSSTSDTFEDELNKMKLNWAGSIIRKTKKLHAMTSSSSSSIDKPPMIAHKSSGCGNDGAKLPKESFVDSNITNNSATISLSSTSETTTTSETPDNNKKKPLNLKEFFAKELLRRTQSSVSSSSSISSPLLEDSTLSSNFLRSLLATSRSSRSDGQNYIGTTTTGVTDKHTTTQRTSTPVKLISTDSTSLSIDGGGITKAGITTTVVDGIVTNYPTTRNDEHLFSAESRLSSVKNHSSSTTTNSSTNINDSGKVIGE